MCRIWVVLLFKMLMNPMGGIVMTNDGNAILREIQVQHPAAKTMIEISRTQDEEVGDGTTSVIILGRSVFWEGEGGMEGYISQWNLYHATQATYISQCNYFLSWWDDVCSRTISGRPNASYCSDWRISPSTWRYVEDYERRNQVLCFFMVDKHNTDETLMLKLLF